MRQVMLAIALIVSIALPVPAVASRTADQQASNPFAVRPVWFPFSSSGTIFPSEWVVVAGEVTAYSPLLDENRPSTEVPPGGYGSKTCWLTLRVVKAIAGGVKEGDSIRIDFSQRFLPPNEYPGSRLGFRDWIRLTGGERLLVTLLKQPKGGMNLSGDIRPLMTYEDMPVRALEEYARWEKLSGQAQLDAMAAATLQHDNPVLQSHAMELFSYRAKAAGRREWAFDILSQVVKGQAPGPPSEALRDMKALYDVEEHDGLSTRILDLYEKLLNDKTVDVPTRIDVVENLVNCAAGYRWYSAGRPPRSPYRPRVLQIVERFLQQPDLDPKLRRSAQDSRDKILEIKKNSFKTIDE